MARSVHDGSGHTILLVHPGGPMWARRDLGWWSIPKGEYQQGDDPRGAALREFAEELGTPCPGHVLIPLDAVRQAGGKVVTAWATTGSIDTNAVVSNTFEMEWPPRSGRVRHVPEIDRAEFFSVDEAQRRILAGQAPLLAAALERLAAAGLL